MSLMIVPEFIIHSTIKSVLLKLKQDLAANAADETKSLLYIMTQGVSFQRYDFFTQAKEIFTRKEDHLRSLECDIAFNMTRNGAPTIHITLPAESVSQGGNGLGVDEHFIDNIDFEEGDDEADPRTAGSDLPILTRRFRAAYNIVITSDNINEVVCIYHILRSLLIAAIGHFELSGLQQISYGGNDVKPYSPELGSKLYFRALTLNCEYDTSTPAFDRTFIPADIFVEGTPESTED